MIAGQRLARADVVVTQPDGDKPLVETEPGHYRLDGAHRVALTYASKPKVFSRVER